MLALVLLVASTARIVCAICLAFLAYKERPQWVWFGALAALAEIGGLAMLSAVRIAPARPARVTSPHATDRVTRRYWLVRP